LFNDISGKVLVSQIIKEAFIMSKFDDFKDQAKDKVDEVKNDKDKQKEVKDQAQDKAKDLKDKF